jgi:hypothetical protein
MLSNYLLSTPPIAIVCHDAGSANFIAHIVKSYRETEEIYVSVSGPAINIWKNILSDMKIYSIDEAIEKSNTLFSGTGWGLVEHNARILANSQGLKNIAVIDHWGSYMDRFLKHGNLYIPDEIIVSDKQSYAIVKTTFPNTNVKIFENLYLEAEVKKVLYYKKYKDKVQKSMIKDILIIADSIPTDKTKNALLSSIEYFMNNLKKLNLLGLKLKIKLRPHPSTNPNEQYLFLGDDILSVIEIDRRKELYEDIAFSDLVLGLNSFALVIASKSGVKAVSILPPFIQRCVLPHKDVLRLDSI